ncbi:MAG: RecB family exonuclease [Polyangiaceae bacterium]
MATFTNEHLSYSRIQRYEQCPRSFRFHYVDKLDSLPGPELVFGKAMHRVLEQLVAEHALEREAAPLSLERAERLWQLRWIQDGLTGVGSFYEGLRMLESFVASDGVVEPSSILAVEQSFEIAIGRFRVVGAIDRVDRTGERSIVVRDYKSGWLIPSREELWEHLQLGIYALAARELWPWAEQVELQLNMLRHDVKLKTSRTDAELDAVRRYVEVLGERLEADEEFGPRPSTACAHCDHRAHCPSFAEDLAGKRNVTATDMTDLEQVAAEREEVSRLANVLYGRKKQLEGVLRAELEHKDGLELGGVHYELAPVTSVEYPVDATLRILQEATGLPRATLTAKLASIDRESLTKLLSDLGKRLPRSRMAMVRAELAARADRTISQRFSAKPVKASMRHEDVAGRG